MRTHGCIGHGNRLSVVSDTWLSLEMWFKALNRVYRRLAEAVSPFVNCNAIRQSCYLVLAVVLFMDIFDHYLELTIL